MTPRTWGELSKLEQHVRHPVCDILAAEFGLRVTTIRAQRRMNALWSTAVWEIDPTDGFWHWRMAAYIHDHW